MNFIIPEKRAYLNHIIFLIVYIAVWQHVMNTIDIYDKNLKPQFTQTGTGFVIPGKCFGENRLKRVVMKLILYIAVDDNAQVQTDTIRAVGGLLCYYSTPAAARPYAVVVVLVPLPYIFEGDCRSDRRQYQYFAVAIVCEVVSSHIYVIFILASLDFGRI
ncbi:hypothetical protein ACJX0J_032791 [Zea mays]